MATNPPFDHFQMWRIHYFLEELIPFINYPDFILFLFFNFYFIFIFIMAIFVNEMRSVSGEQFNSKAYIYIALCVHCLINQIFIV